MNLIDTKGKSRAWVNIYLVFLERSLSRFIFREVGLSENGHGRYSAGQGLIIKGVGLQKQIVFPPIGFRPEIDFIKLLLVFN